MSTAADTEVFNSLPPLDLLFVEDEPIARKELTRLLLKQGYKVNEAPTGSSAVLHAQKGMVGVVLMDIKLDGQLDGIDLAREIKLIQPFTSFIFVSAFARESTYHDRALEAGIRIGGWIDKPIDQDKIEEIFRTINKEQTRLQVLVRLEQARKNGLELLTYLTALTDFGLVTESLFNEIAAELGAEEFESEEVTLAGKIESVFDQMQALIERDPNNPNLPNLLQPLEEHLETLESEEARLIQLNYQTHFDFRPEEGRRLIDEIKSLLGDGE